MKSKILQMISTQSHEEMYDYFAKLDAKIWDDLNLKQVTNWVEIFLKTVKAYPNAPFLTNIEDGRIFSYSEVNVLSNKIYNYVKREIQQSRISILIEDPVNFIACLIAVNKASKEAVLINYNDPNVNHQMNIADSDVLITEAEINDILNNESIEDDCSGIFHFSNNLEDPAFIIFTSGTSGQSKAAKFSHKRMIDAGIKWHHRTLMDDKDTCYISVPLFHGNGLAVALSSVITAQAHAVIRKKFSTSRFLEDIDKYQCSHMIYIGELWRYLCNANLNFKKYQNALKVIFGNGLNKDLWQEVIDKFKIDHVVEHYGATEMPGAALINWTNKEGYCGYIPKSHKDHEIYRVIPIPEGELFIKTFDNYYSGYVNEMDNQKVVKDIEGAVYWSSGDILKLHNSEFYQFIDRKGNNYRFKGENISSSYVESIIYQSNLFEEVIVTGISYGQEGSKVGFAILKPLSGLTIKNTQINQLAKYLRAHLKPEAMPYFIKITHKKNVTTSTYKFLRSGYLFEDFLDESDTFCLIDSSYRHLTQSEKNKMKQGKFMIKKSGVVI